MRVIGEDGEAVDLNPDEILYFTIHNNQVFVKTKHNQYLLPTSLEQVHQAYKGIGFDKADRSFIINLEKAIGYDEDRLSVYFDEDNYVPVSEKNQRRIKEHIQNKQTRE